MLNEFLDKYGIKIYKQYQYDALLSVVYNTPSWLNESPDKHDLVKLLIEEKNGQFNSQAIRDEIISWRSNKDRRVKEGILFEQGIYN